MPLIVNIVAENMVTEKTDRIHKPLTIVILKYL